MRAVAKRTRLNEKKRPLWTCPKCGHRFVTPNIWHSCSRYPLSYHFKGKEPIVRKLFDDYLELVESFGPTTVISQKTRIAFQVRVRFAGAVTRKHWLDCAMWLKRRADHPLFYRIESVTAVDHVHRFRLTSPEDLRDRTLKLLLHEAYRVGCQEHLYRKKGLRQKKCTSRENCWGASLIAVALAGACPGARNEKDGDYATRFYRFQNNRLVLLKSVPH